MKVMAGGFRRAKPGDKTADILKREGAMLSALKWVLKNKNVGTTIPSITDNEQLEEEPEGDVGAVLRCGPEDPPGAVGVHPPAVLQDVRRLLGPVPEGAAGFRRAPFTSSYAEGYGQFQLARESFLSLAPEIRDVRCKDCSSCPIQCPNGVRVTERLQTAQELLA